jgi:superfamily I DNA and/or RNA helicase
VTLFERLHAQHGAIAAQMLTVQYRMHERIMSWSSNALYGGRVRAATSVAHHSLEDIAPVGSGVAAGAKSSGNGEEAPDLAAPDLAAPLVLVDTAGCSMEEAEEEGGSHRNDGEAAVAVALVQEHVALGVREDSIGIITPYSAQRARCGSLEHVGDALVPHCMQSRLVHAPR